jgi:hypothetical protein
MDKLTRLLSRLWSVVFGTPRLGFKRDLGDAAFRRRAPQRSWSAAEGVGPRRREAALRAQPESPDIAFCAWMYYLN